MGSASLASLLEESIRDVPVPDDDLDLFEDVRWAYVVEALNGRVSTFFVVFASILTQYDKQIYASETKRGGRGNIYRLSLWFEALDRVKAHLQGVMNDDSKEAVAKLKDALSKEFTKGNPGDKMLRVVDAYLTKGTLPKIPISKEVKVQMAAERAKAKLAKAAAGHGSVAMAAESIDDGIAITEGEHDELVELGGQTYGRRRGGGDPRWMEAKFAGTAKDGTSFRKGDRVLYFPSTKSFFVGKDADREWKAFQSAKGDEEGTPYAEGQTVEPAMSIEDDETKPGAFKISSKALQLLKKELGGDWKPEQALFKQQRKVVDDLSNDDLITLFGSDSQDRAQDFISGSPKKAFLKWLAMASRVSPKLGKLVRSQPENAALLFYMTVTRVSGRDMADIILKRYFETESDHVGVVKAKMKVEELEEAILEARVAAADDIEEAIDEYDNIVKTMRQRLVYNKAKNLPDDTWLRGAILDEVKRMEQQSKLLRRLLERDA